MNFTRDPIIETVITPKEGFKLLVRPSGVVSGEEYQVDAVEVVSFGKSIFFRSLEKPKAFLLPVSDYEIVEIKETRVVLKKASIEKPIKIAGGKPSTPPKEEQPKEVEASQKKGAEEKEEEPKKGKKRKKSRSKKGKRETEEEASAEQEEQIPPPPRKMRALIPPPSALISDSISKYKHAITSANELLPEGVEGSTTGDAVSEGEKPQEIPPSTPEINPQDEVSATTEEETLEEYHPQEDDTIDQSLLYDYDLDEEDPLLKHHKEDE